MLRHSFIQIPGVGRVSEQRLWQAGVLSWDDFRPPYPDFLSARQIGLIERFLAEATREPPETLKSLRQLPSSERWRLYRHFRDAVAFLDIETTGLSQQHSEITCIGLYDGENCHSYVRGENLGDFPEAIGHYRLLVTYNGSGFDLPMIERCFDIRLRQFHIDLRPLLRSLGFVGGLKGCERQLGLDRGVLTGVDGFFAVRLWQEYRRTKRREALDTLLAYNLEDTVNLEALLVTAWNLKLMGTPFAESHHLPLPPAPPRPFAPDLGLIRRMLVEFGDLA